MSITPWGITYAAVVRRFFMSCGYVYSKAHFRSPARDPALPNSSAAAKFYATGCELLAPSNKCYVRRAWNSAHKSRSYFTLRSRLSMYGIGYVPYCTGVILYSVTQQRTFAFASLTMTINDLWCHNRHPTNNLFDSNFCFVPAKRIAAVPTSGWCIRVKDETIVFTS